MSFHLTLERLRDAALTIPTADRQRGLKDNRLVLLKDLRELLRAFDSVDNMARELYEEVQKLKKEIQSLKDLNKESQATISKRGFQINNLKKKNLNVN